MVVVTTTASQVHAENIIMQTPAKLLVKDQDLGNGTLYITENNVIWSGEQAGVPPPITLLYTTISCHGVQRVPFGALYMVLDFELKVGNQPAVAPVDEDSDDDFDPDNQPITELRFIPANEADLPAMYLAMNQGQVLHPEPPLQPEDDEDDHYVDGEDQDHGDDEQFEDAEEAVALPEDAAIRLQQLQLNQGNGHQGNGHQAHAHQANGHPANANGHLNGHGHENGDGDLDEDDEDD